MRGNNEQCVCLQPASKSTICSRVLGQCRACSVFSSSGAISCSYTFIPLFQLLWRARRSTRLSSAFCIFLTRYSCLLVITAESYKQGEVRRVFLSCHRKQLLIYNAAEAAATVHADFLGAFTLVFFLSLAFCSLFFCLPPPPYISLTAVVAGSA